MSLFNLDTQPPINIIDLSNIVCTGIVTQCSATDSTSNDDAELTAITNNTSSIQTEPVKKKRTYKPRVKKNAPPTVTAVPGNDTILVASFEGITPADAATKLTDSVPSTLNSNLTTCGRRINVTSDPLHCDYNPVHTVHDFSINESQFKPEELELNPIKDVFVKNSRIKNDELVKYYILKYKICDYNCSGKLCPMKQGIWRRRPAYLILNRKNNKPSDLTIPNISLICPNCYVQDKGAELFNKFRNQSDSKCIGCGYIVKKGYELCYVCTEKIKKTSVLSTTDDIAELTLRTSTIQLSKPKQSYAPIFGLSSFDNDIDKEIKELGIKFTNCNSAPVKLQEPILPPIMIDVDSELAKYKNILDTDMSGQTTTTKRKSHVPSGDVHYTKHKHVNTVSHSVLNTNVTQELLDQLADIIN